MPRHSRILIKSVVGLEAILLIIAVFHLGGSTGHVINQFVPLSGACIGAMLVFLSVLRPMSKSRQSVETFPRFERGAWILIGFGILSWGLGEICWRYLVAHGMQPFPSIADVGYVGFSLFILFGLLMQAASHPEIKRLFLLLDTIISTCTIFAILWYLLFGLSTYESGEPNIGKFLNFYYVVADTALVSCAIFLLLRELVTRGYRTRSRRISMFLTATGLFLFGLSDFIAVIQLSVGTLVGGSWIGIGWSLIDGSWVDVGWSFGMVAIGLAAYIHRYMPIDLMENASSLYLTRKPVTLVLRWLQYLPYPLLAVLFFVLLLNTFSNDHVSQLIRPVLFTATLVAVSLVLVRQFLTMRDNVWLIRQQHTTQDLAGRLAMESTRLVLGQQAGKIGTFEWSIRTGFITWTPELEALYDMAPGTFGGRFEQWSERLHPDDRSRFVEGIMRAIETRTPFFSEFRIVCPDGSHRWMTTKAEIFVDAERNEPRMIGINIDVTRRKHLEDEVKRSKEQLETILQNVADGIIVQDTDGTIIFANKVAVHLSAFPSIEALFRCSAQGGDDGVYGKGVIEDERGQPFMAEQFPGRRALQGEQNVQAIMQYHDAKTEQTGWVLVKAEPIFDEEGGVQSAVSVLIDITERQELEQRKNVFISMASHELKTPVTSLKGFTYVLRRRFTKVEDTEGLQFLTRMDAQLNRLTKLVSDLLDISRMQASQLIYKIETFDIDSLIHETVETLQGTIQSHHISIEGLACTQVMGDADRLGQVLVNLLNNAIKYSPQADKVIVRVSRDQENLVVVVKDFGIGIAEVDQQKIFERFYQIAGLEEKTYPGLGISLHLSNEIINRHGGKIWVESRKGEGSSFYFTLPLPKHNRVF